MSKENKNGGKGHLRAWESHQSTRAKDKKNRAKLKSKGGAEHPEDSDSDFLISREEFQGSFGVVASSTKGRFSVLFNDQVIEATLSPDADFSFSKAIVVGDHVTLKQQYGKWQIDHMLERQTNLTRLRKDGTRLGLGGAEEHVIAANINIAVIVAAAKNPPFHPKFIDRYLVLVKHGGIKPVVCLNKTDLLEPDKKFEILGYYQEMGIPVVFTSTETQQGIDELRELIRGQSAVLVGHSGVGKSSLINSLVPTADATTGKVSEKGGKGRHTTTNSELLQWDSESLIIDTPGVRSLGMWEIDPQDLQLYFVDIAGHAESCKFSDCLHIKVDQKLCGVLQAVERGDIPLARYESYTKLLTELEN